MRILLCLLISCSFSILAQKTHNSTLVSSQLEREHNLQVVGGAVYRFELPFAGKTRMVDVFMPQVSEGQKGLKTLYMHDGQMLYDASSTWNKTEWEVDEVLTELEKSGKIKETIVVGIWNGEKTRHADYFPQKPFKNLKKSQKAKRKRLSALLRLLFKLNNGS